MSQSLANQKKLAKTFIEREETWDAASIIELRTDNCTYEIVPKDLNFPLMNNEQCKRFYDQLRPVWQNYKVTTLQEIHDAEEHTCAIYINNNSGSAVGPFDVDTIWWLHFTEDGTKIRKVKEVIIDSERLAAWLAKLPKPEGESS